MANDVPWIKILTNLPDDEKIKIIDTMPDRDAILVIWIKLIIQAGKTNAGGYVYLTPDKPYTDEMIAAIFNRPLNTIRLALDTFCSLKMIEIDEKGIIFLPNFPKIQNLDRLEHIRQLNRERQSRYRDKIKESNALPALPVTLRHATEGEGEGEGEGEIEIEVEEEDPCILKKDSRNIQGLYIKAPGEGKNAFPSPASDKYFEQIYQRLIESYTYCFISIKDRNNGKQIGGKVLAQIRDLTTELCAGKCEEALVLEAFKEAANANKPYISYARAILFDWLGLSRKKG